MEDKEWIRIVLCESPNNPNRNGPDTYQWKWKAPNGIYHVDLDGEMVVKKQQKRNDKWYDLEELDPVIGFPEYRTVAVFKPKAMTNFEKFSLLEKAETTTSDGTPPTGTYFKAESQEELWKELWDALLDGGENAVMYQFTISRK